MTAFPPAFRISECKNVPSVLVVGTSVGSLSANKRLSDTEKNALLREWLSHEFLRLRSRRADHDRSPSRNSRSRVTLAEVPPCRDAHLLAVSPIMPQHKKAER